MGWLSFNPADMPYIRTLLVTVCSIAISSMLSGQRLAELSFGTDTTLDIATWNIEMFPTAGVNTMDTVSAIIRQLDLDIIALQEIDDTLAFAEMMASLPDYQVIFTTAGLGGLAYLYKPSEVQVRSVYTIYDTYWRAFPRTPMVMEVSYFDDDFVLINNHFKCCGDGLIDVTRIDDEEMTRFNASNLLKLYIDDNLPGAKVIVLGDLNDRLTDEESDNVFQAFLEDSLNYFFADEDIAHGPMSDWSFPSWPSHLDHILVTDELSGILSNAGSQVATIKVDDYLAGGYPAYQANVSDHRPVAIKLRTDAEIVPLREAPQRLPFAIFPNPARDQLQIRLPAVMDDAQVTLYNARGQQYLSQALVGSRPTIWLDASLPAGLYFVQVVAANKVGLSPLSIVR